MHYKSFVAVLGAIVFSGAVYDSSRNIASAQRNLPSEARFICSEKYQSVPTTFAWTAQGKTPIIQWTTQTSPNYPPEKRCQMVSAKFDEAYRNGNLNFLTNAVLNRQPVICAAREFRGSCSTVLITLRRGENSLQFLRNLTAVINGRIVAPMQQSSGEPQIYFKLDLDKMLTSSEGT
jgi:Circadian oscillating protein COP23